MARGWWTRWGRGDCVGYGLVIGEGPFSFRADVVRSMPSRDQRIRTWRASVNGVSVAEGVPDANAAKAKIAAELDGAMREALRDWEIFKATLG